MVIVDVRDFLRGETGQLRANGVATGRERREDDSGRRASVDERSRRRRCPGCGASA